MKTKLLPCLFLLFGVAPFCAAQNSLIGDGFGGRLWYQPYNYTVSSYAGFTICGDERQLYGWGNDSKGELGDGGIVPGSAIPVAIPGIKKVKYFTGGYFFAAVLQDSSGWIWGGRVFVNSGDPPLLPQMVIQGVRFADAGARVSSFVKWDGTVWSLGYNRYGVFGNGSSNYSRTAVPVQMTGISNAVRTASGNACTYILLADGTVKSTGRNIYTGGLGVGVGIDSSSIPVNIPGLANIVDIKTNAYAAIALDNNGDVWQWGRTTFVPSTESPFYTPHKLTALTNIVAISGCDDGFHFLALDKNHNCYAWGDNNSGQCGNGGTTRISCDTPQLVATNVNDILAGEFFSYIIKTDGSLYATGSSNGNGASIWLNLPNINRASFTQLEPTLPPLNLCAPVPVSPPHITSPGDTTLCAGDTLKVAIPSGCTVSVSPLTGCNINTSSGFVEFFGSGSATYTVITLPLNANDPLFQGDTVSFTIGRYPPPVADFAISPSSATIYNPDFSFTNQSTHADRYQWFYNGQLIDTTQHINYRFPDKGTYCITLVATNVCGQTDSATHCCIVSDKGKVFIPNSFSPNGDGVNDFFKTVLWDGTVSGFELSVFNRYGQKVFTTRSADDGWDGTFHNKLSDAGTYYYYLKITFDFPGAAEEIYKGDLTLIR